MENIYSTLTAETLRKDINYPTNKNVIVNSSNKDRKSKTVTISNARKHSKEMQLYENGFCLFETDIQNKNLHTQSSINLLHEHIVNILQKNFDVKDAILLGHKFRSQEYQKKNDFSPLQIVHADWNGSRLKT